MRKTVKTTTWNDPIVDEVRAVRDKLARQFNYDLNSIVEHLSQQQPGWEAQGFKFVSYPSRKIRPKTGTHS